MITFITLLYHMCQVGTMADRADTYIWEFTCGHETVGGNECVNACQVCGERDLRRKTRVSAYDTRTARTAPVTTEELHRAGKQLARQGDSAKLLGKLIIAERDFLAASVEVWREIDRLSEKPGGYRGLDSSTDLRIAEREAWERYRRLLDAVA